MKSKEEINKTLIKEFEEIRHDFLDYLGMFERDDYDLKEEFRMFLYYRKQNYGRNIN